MWIVDLQKNREDQIWSDRGRRSAKARSASPPSDLGVAQGPACAWSLQRDPFTIGGWDAVRSMEAGSKWDEFKNSKSQYNADCYPRKFYIHVFETPDPFAIISAPSRLTSPLFHILRSLLYSSTDNISDPPAMLAGKDPPRSAIWSSRLNRMFLSSLDEIVFYFTQLG